MVEHVPLDIPDDGKIVDNITHFAQALRKAGLKAGPTRTLYAIEAVAAVGFDKKSDFYWTLQSCFVSKPAERLVFDQIFRLYWRDPQFLEHMMAMMLPAIRGVQEENIAKPAEKRAAEALLNGANRGAPAEKSHEGQEIEVNASLTMSREEKLRTLDFEQMSVDEMDEAKRMLARIKLPIRPLKSRRMRLDQRGQVPDWRSTMRTSLRTGGEINSLMQKKRTERWPNLVIICDISGSMTQYSRAILHFLHAVANTKGQGWAKVHGFTFGTQLTNITRHLRGRDVDEALACAGKEASDWDGGTRIGACLRQFNKEWSRRVLGQGALVILMTDGLDRGEPELLAQETRRLQLSAKKLIWLNPLLRWDQFAPKAGGIARMLPHVDSFRAGHNIASVEELAQSLSAPDDIGEHNRMMQLLS
ncbi:vWA domain-containing protein [Cochlodiniinecator piscidefendens]|uniref:vWA domain-containing protein n=1 Tax=Cochlodiniinecator piscidefendens TaxID=2715756 RepID=UPI00140D7D81|nr:VWA domain-containing protein [Cochlodiniinecator piscidefendens]